MPKKPTYEEPERRVRKAEQAESERKKAQEHGNHIRQILVATRNINRLIRQENDPQRLIDKACTTLTETMGYHNAWIVLTDGTGGVVTMTATSGNDGAFFSVPEGPESAEFPVCFRQALTQDGTVMTEAPPSQCRNHSLSGECGGRSRLIRRLAYGASLYGVLCVSVPAGYAYDPEEQNLLREVAEDLSFALNKIETEEQSHHLENIVKNIPYPMSVISEEYRYLAVNDIYAELYNTSPQMIVGQTQADFLGQEVFETEIRSHLDRCLSGQTVRYEIYVNLPGKGLRWMEVSYFPYMDKTGNIRGVIAHGLDITERKKAEEQLRTHLHFLESLDRINEALLQAEDIEEMLLSAMDIVLSIFDCDRAWLLYPCDPHAPSWRVPIERTRPECPGAFANNAEVAMTPDVAETFQELLDTDEPVFDVISPGDPLWDPDDRYGVRSFMSIAIHPRTGKPWDFGLHQCTYARVWTVAEQRLFKEIGRRIADMLSLLLILRDLRESEEKFRSLVESSSDLIWEVSEKCEFTYVSPQVESILGYKPNEILGKTPFDFMAPDEAARIAKIFDDSVRLGKPITRLENTGLHKEGHPIVLETSGVPIMGEDGNVTGYRGVDRDVTGRRQAEAEQQRLKTQLAQVRKMESVGRLAGGVAHDFNNMLSVILGNTEIILEDINPADRSIKNLKEIYNAAERSANLTRQLLAFARKQSVSPKILDLNATLEEMINMLQRLIGEDIDLSWLPSEKLWPVRIDPSQVDQILANLCVNARDAIKGGGRVTIETENASVDEHYCLKHAGFNPGDYVMLAVSDNGCGMDKETLDNLFEPFFTTKDVGQGSGLGLATVYGIVKQNKGFINVYSEPDEGTTFKIYLPRHSETVVSEQKNNSAKTPRTGHETILLVEDEEAVLSMTKVMLERLGYTVLAASTPNEAIRIVEESAFCEIHLLITDVVMPEMNGRELAEKLLPLHPKLKYLFMSGYTANVIAHHGVLNNGVEFINKPFLTQDLATKVRDVLDKAKSPTQ